MTYTLLISTDELAEHLNDPDWIVVDCRFVLAAPERGEQNYLHSHIPGAIYAHLERDLSSPVIPGVTGRHPWLGAEQTVEALERLGIGSHMQVVAYDDAGGALAATRLWGMLRWLGHEAVAILDGGWQKWVNEDRDIAMGLETRPAQSIVPRLRPELIADIVEVDRMRLDPACRVFDARTLERYHGQNETIDPIAGHIPGAYSAPYLENLTEDLTLRSPEELRAHYKALLGEIPAERVAFYCGSGVTSIHNVLAVMIAGLGEARVYAGSWSEWIADRKRPVAT
ncbi:MAG: sulfurtransferase [Anaerolineales bacterium]|nr:sulfurtransferase [Anaerolineales bacterium]